MNYSAPASLSLSDDILKIIDAPRGDIPRSRWMILEGTYKQNSNTTKLEGQRKGNRRGQDLIGQNIVIPSQPSKQICEAIGCSAQATKQIHVRVGQKGMICLYLCSSCVCKFA